MNWECIKNLGHSYEKVGDIKPIKYDSEFSTYAYDGHYALGRCKWCGTKKLLRCTGQFRFTNSEMRTRVEYMEEWQLQEAKDLIKEE